MWQDMLSPSLESLYDRQQTANRAGDSALSARRVLRPGSSLSSSSVGHTAAAAGHRVHRERESKVRKTQERETQETYPPVGCSEGRYVQRASSRYMLQLDLAYDLAASPDQ